MSDSVKQKPVHAVRRAPSAAKPPKGIPVSSGRGGCQQRYDDIPVFKGTEGYLTW